MVDAGTPVQISTSVREIVRRDLDAGSLGFELFAALFESQLVCLELGEALETVYFFPFDRNNGFGRGLESFTLVSSRR